MKFFVNTIQVLFGIFLILLGICIEAFVTMMFINFILEYIGIVTRMSFTLSFVLYLFFAAIYFFILIIRKD